jgi:hypothetical protein
VSGPASGSNPHSFESILIAALGDPPVEPLPSKATAKTLRQAIAETLEKISANDLAEECVRFGMAAPQSETDDPWRSKYRYVMRRVRDYDMPGLIALARAVNEEHDSSLLTHLLSLTGARGVDGEVKNLIFAANGPKPELVLRDFVSNVIEITRNAEFCLVYDLPVGEGGLTWRALTRWWAGNVELDPETERAKAAELYRRLFASMAGNEAEQMLFAEFCSLYRTNGFDTPALIPQVYLHYDPYSRGADGPLVRQRMDFLLLLPQQRRVVIELDGRQHYADEKGRADTARYAEMVAEDRRLRLAGYEVYRFGGAEFVDRRRAVDLLGAFFASLLELPT